MRGALTVCALGFALCSATPSYAKVVRESDVTSGNVQLDPSMGYIFVSGSTRLTGLFLRVPDQGTRNAYEQDRLAAFAKAQKHYRADLREWRSHNNLLDPSLRPLPGMPEEPKLADITIDPIELRDMEGFGPLYVFAKSENFSYLNAVKPGTWIYYGPLMLAANGATAGECFCLGTVRFEVKPGVVTDLGNSLSVAPQWDSDMDVGRLQLKETNTKRVAEGKEPIGVDKGPLAYGLPATLASWPSVKAELHASPKMNNYFGATVTRMAPIPGVLAYHRDVVVDERTGQEIASPTIISRAKIKL